MKRFIVTMVCVVVATFSVSAQQKGDMYIGCDFGIGVNNTSLSASDYGSLGSETSVEFAIQPKFGVFVAKNFMIGVGVGYGVESMYGATHHPLDGATVHALTLGPTFSYYVPLCEGLYYTPTIDLAYCLAASDGESLSGFGLGVTLFGLEYRPTPRIGISGGLLSLDYSLFAQEGAAIHSLDLSLTINPTIGVKLYF